MQPPWPCHQSVLSPSSVHSIESLSVVTFRFSVYPSSVLSNRSLFFNCSCCRRRCLVAVFFFVIAEPESSTAMLTWQIQKEWWPTRRGLRTLSPGMSASGSSGIHCWRLQRPQAAFIAVTTPYTENREPKGRKIHTMTSALSNLCSNETSLKQTARPVSCCYSVIFFDAI